MQHLIRIILYLSLYFQLEKRLDLLSFLKKAETHHELPVVVGLQQPLQVVQLQLLQIAAAVVGLEELQQLEQHALRHDQLLIAEYKNIMNYYFSLMC